MAAIPFGRTLVILKDAVARGLVGAILGRFEAAGLAIVAAKLTRPSIEFARSHYAGSAIRGDGKQDA
jgi:nucleoside-diphosphate kinase